MVFIQIVNIILAVLRSQQTIFLVAVNKPNFPNLRTMRYRLVLCQVPEMQEWNLKFSPSDLDGRVKTNNAMFILPLCARIQV